MLRVIDRLDSLAHDSAVASRMAPGLLRSPMPHPSATVVTPGIQT